MFKFNEYIKKNISKRGGIKMSLELLKTRLQYAGGNQEQRMIKGKLESLKKAMLYSYQAATAILSDGREFRCLINPDKLKEKYDGKIISIPFEDICIGRIIAWVLVNIVDCDFINLDFSIRNLIKSTRCRFELFGILHSHL